MSQLLNRILFGPASDIGDPFANMLESEPRYRVLMIDDEAMVIRVVQRLLSQQHDVTAVQSGAAALLLLEQGERFDAVLCDYGLPYQNGAEVYAELERRWPELSTHFVLMTGSAETEAVSQFTAATGVRCVAKPLRAAELFALVREVGRAAK